jgi:hypothetical protein
VREIEDDCLGCADDQPERCRFFNALGQISIKLRPAAKAADVINECDGCAVWVAGAEFRKQCHDSKAEEQWA